MSQHPFPPPEVMRVIERYQKPGDTPEIFPCFIKYEGKKYVDLRYLPSDTFLIVKADGVVPSFEEAKPILEFTSNMSGLNRIVYTTVEEFVKSKTIRLYTRLLKVLDKIDQNLRHQMPREIETALDTFIQVAQQAIYYQKEIEKYYKLSDELICETERRQLITSKDRQKLNDYTTKVGESVKSQNFIQLESYDQRKKFMKYLVKRVILRPDLWWYTYELYFNHRHMYNHLTAEDKRIYDEVEETVYERGEYLASSKRTLQEVFNNCLNQYIDVYESKQSSIPFDSKV